MPRLYHSVSEVVLKRRCFARAAYKYVVGLSEGPPGAGADLGGEVHEIGEAYFGDVEEYDAGLIDWGSKPGLIFQSGLHHLPTPEAARLAGPVHVERPIGLEPMPKGVGKHAPPLGFRWNGILWAGYIDLTVNFDTVTAERLERTAVKAGAPMVTLPVGVPILHDYKSSGSISQYALTPQTHPDDPQLNLYALSDMVEHERDQAWGRWLYLETKKVRRSLPVFSEVNFDRAVDVVGSMCEDAKALDGLRPDRVDAKDLKNPDDCHSYGKLCAYHRLSGGPCDPKQGAAWFMKKRKEQIMAQSAAEKFKARQAAKLAEQSGEVQSTDLGPSPDLGPDQDAPTDELTDELETTPKDEADAREVPDLEPVKPKATPKQAKPAAAVKAAPATKASELSTLVALLDVAEANVLELRRAIAHAALAGVVS